MTELELAKKIIEEQNLLIDICKSKIKKQDEMIDKFEEVISLKDELMDDIKAELESNKKMVKGCIEMIDIMNKERESVITLTFERVNIMLREFVAYSNTLKSRTIYQSDFSLVGVVTDALYRDIRGRSKNILRGLEKW